MNTIFWLLFLFSTFYPMENVSDREAANIGGFAIGTMGFVMIPQDYDYSGGMTNEKAGQLALWVTCGYVMQLCLRDEIMIRRDAKKGIYWK